MNVIRRLAELLSRGKVIKRKILVNNKLVPILVTPDAQLKYLKPGAEAFDQDLINIAQNHLSIDSNVWDIGANVGVFTFAASTIAKSGHVVSIEADTWLAGILNKTAKYSEYANNKISILPIAVSNEISILSFMIASRGRASNALEVAGGRSQMGGVREIQYVPSFTLDSLLDKFPCPDFVKIDVEGAELLVVQGAKELINRGRPKFYIEVGIDVSEEILEIFRDAKYVALNQDGKEITDVCTSNTFFIPKERL